MFSKDEILFFLFQLRTCVNEIKDKFEIDLTINLNINEDQWELYYQCEGNLNSFRNGSDLSPIARFAICIKNNNIFNSIEVSALVGVILSTTFLKRERIHLRCEPQRAIFEESFLPFIRCDNDENRLKNSLQQLIDEGILDHIKRGLRKSF